VTESAPHAPKPQARDLAGKSARFVVELDSPEWPEEGRVGWQCKNADQDSKIVWLPEGRAVDGPSVIVEGKVSVLEHRAKDGFPGFTELRLVGVPLQE